ncbi:MAG: DUF4919 domain-containing protein [Sphingobacteriaceae bacterium]|nr:DUF4919 domain-containing protein [Sphingobacteriaceae bacterium]
MLKKLIILLVAFSFITNAQNNFTYKTDFKTILAKTKDANDKLCYDKLLSRFNKNDSTLTNAEVLALLIGFTAKPEYKPYEDMLVENDIYNLNAEGKYYDARIKANEFMQTHPLSVKVIFERAFSYYKGRFEDSAKIFASQGNKIFNAMKYSGKGKTMQDPIFALSPQDGQEYIYKFLSGGIGLKGSLKDENGNTVDFLEVTSKVKEPYNLYFIIQHATEKMPLKLESAVEKEKREKRESEK